MAELTPKQVAAAKARKAIEVVIPKQVAVSNPLELSGMNALLSQFQSMVKAQQEGQQALVKSLDDIAHIIQNKDLKHADMGQLTRAILSMRQEVVTEKATEWEFDIERDHRQLLSKVKATPMKTIT